MRIPSSAIRLSPWKILPPLFLILVGCLSACQADFSHLASGISTNLTAQSMTATGCSYPVGIINSLDTPQGKELMRGYEIALDEIKNSGGINGCALNLIVKDDQNSPVEAEKAARELIEVNKVPVILGSYASSCTLEIAKVANEMKVPLIVPNSTSTLITQMGYQWVFRLPASSIGMLETAFNWLQTVTDPASPPSLAIIYQYNLSGTSTASTFLNLAAQKGWSVVSYAKFLTGTSDFKAILDSMRNVNPDVIFITADAADDVSFLLQQMRDKNINPKAIIGITGAFADPDFITKNKTNADYLIIGSQWSPGVPWQDEKGNTTGSFIRDFQARYESLPGNRSIQSYLALKLVQTVLMQALTKGKTELPQNIQQALLSFTSDNTLFGPIRFDAFGQNAHPALLTQIKEGESSLIFPPEFRTKKAIFPMPIMRADTAAQMQVPLEGRAPSSPQQIKSVLKIGNQQTITTFNPLWAGLNIERLFFRQIYDTLFEIGDDGNYKQLLARQIQRSEDGKVYTFSLPPNAKFHDGHPLTAKDVVFSLNLYHNTKESVRYNDTILFDKVEAKDDYTVVLTLKEAVPVIADKLSQLYILPEHLWSPLTETPEFLKSSLNIPTVGSGSFKLVDYKINDSLRMAANRDHYLRRPKIDEMIWQTYRDQDSLVNALIKGDIDAVDFVPPPAINAIKNVPNVQIINGFSARPTFTDIIINQIDPRNCPPSGKCSGHPALRDIKVRQALAYGTDKQRIIQVSMQGMAIPGISVIPNGLGIWYNSDLADYPFDTALGNQILDEAGYLDINNDGVREMPDRKTPLKFKLFYASNNPSYLYERLAQILNDNWSQLGIQLNIQALKEGDLVSMVNPGFQHDIVLWSWGVNPDPDFILSVLTTTQILGGNSETGYSNPEYDTLYDQQSKELDITKRKDIVWKMQQIILSNVVYIIPYYDQIAFAVRTDRFNGWPFGQKKIMPEDPGLLSELEPVR